MTQAKDLSGQIFGYLTVMAREGSRGGRALWLCLCSCGNHHLATSGHLIIGGTRSCGCRRRERKPQKTSRRDQSKAWRSWMSMRQRCFDSSMKSYHNYGGRGITVCERWLKFENFHADMGDPPPGCTIDRINNDGNYEPGNCRWATPKEQSRNRRTNRIIEFGGRSQCITDWAKELGINKETIRNRLGRGWPVERCLTKF